jgi:LytS/YehU family sensor histidine kinase
MLSRLGDLLRMALRRDSQPETTLAEEISLSEAYVAVEKMRFGERLSVIFEIAPETRQAQVPSLILQPLVENAIIHGLSGASKPGRITIQSAKQNGQITLTVNDNGVGLHTRSLRDLEIGVGLGSTCDRLARMYPEQHEFSVRELSEGGAEIRVVLPFRLGTVPAKIASS